MRQVVLDTETTGLDPQQGHRVIEIGCVEIEDRKLTGNHFHCYINPQREVDAGALEVHGISNAFLADKPLFEQVESDFIDFVRGAELVIHNAPFDIGFLDHELAKTGTPETKMASMCSVLDTLQLARQKHPGSRVNLDALCKRYFVDNTQRDLHGALLDAEILADVYLLMTSGQSNLLLQEEQASVNERQTAERKFNPDRAPLPIIMAEGAELEAHAERLQEIDAESEGGCVWLSVEAK